MQSNCTFLKNAIGFVQKNSSNDSIFYGRRDNIIIENVGAVKYSISNKSSFNFRCRHYWSNVTYRSYYLLQKDGKLSGFDLAENCNTNYNALNNDISYVWQFLPGSEISVVLKNYYALSNQNVDNSYIRNLKNTFSSPLLNAISVKLIYYIDYAMFKKNVKQ